MYNTEDVKIQKLQVNDYVLGRDDLVYRVVEIKPFGEDETFMTLKSMNKSPGMLGSSLNETICTKILNY